MKTLGLDSTLVPSLKFQFVFQDSSPTETREPWLFVNFTRIFSKRNSIKGTSHKHLNWYKICILLPNIAKVIKDFEQGRESIRFTWLTTLPSYNDHLPFHSLWSIQIESTTHKYLNKYTFFEGPLGILVTLEKAMRICFFSPLDRFWLKVLLINIWTKTLGLQGLCTGWDPN